MRTVPEPYAAPPTGVTPGGFLLWISRMQWTTSRRAPSATSSGCWDSRSRPGPSDARSTKASSLVEPLVRDSGVRLTRMGWLAGDRGAGLHRRGGDSHPLCFCVGRADGVADRVHG